MGKMGRTAAFAFASVVAIAACLSAASPLGGVVDGTTLDGDLASVSASPQGHTDIGYLGHPWMASVLAPAYAAGDAYVITDLGNMFKLDIERPPGINWTQVLLDKIAEETRRSRESVDDLRRDAQEDTNRVRDIINNYIQNNTILLDERSRQFEQFRTLTNMSISDMINRDSALNASINQLVQNIRQDTYMSTEAAVSAISSQVHFVNYDSPATIMTCTANACTTADIAPFMSVPSTITSYIIYDDPKWLAPSTYTVSPVHYNAQYFDEDTVTLKTIIADDRVRLFEGFTTYDYHTSNGREFYSKTGKTDNMKAGQGLPSTPSKYTNILVWGCYLSYYYCFKNDGTSWDWTRPPVYNTMTIETPVGYPYHVNMIAKESSPHIPPGPTFNPGDSLPNNMPGSTADHVVTSIQSGKIKTAYGIGQSASGDASRQARIYGAAQTPFDAAHLSSSTENVMRYGADELVVRGIGHSGALLGYLSTSTAKASLPVSQTTSTWPNCTNLPTCRPLTFAIGDYIPRGSPLNDVYASTLSGEVGGSWPVFISPQMRISTWGSHNALNGEYSASPQFIDRMHRQILVPTFESSPPASEAGKLYDIQGYVRIPFAPEEPMNVTHVSLRPSAASGILDLEGIGRAYIADSDNTPSNLYNINEREFEKMGLVNCSYGRPGMTSMNLYCDEIGNRLDRTTHEGLKMCVFMGSGSFKCATTLADVGEIILERPTFTPDGHARLPQLEGAYNSALDIPMVNGYSGFRLVIDGVALYTKYSDVRTDNYLFLSPPKHASVGKTSASPIHGAEASVTTSSYVVATRDGDMSIMAVVSATGTLGIVNEYYVNVRPPRPIIIDPLSVTMTITKNGVHYATEDIGINEHPAAAANSTLVDVPLVRGGLDQIATRSVSYDYPSFVFAGTTTVPVSAGDHVLFELTAKIEGEIDPWVPSQGTVSRTEGTSSADVSINAASIMMGVG